MSVTTVRLRPELEKDLEAMGEKYHRSKSWLINEAIKEYIEHQERDQARWQGTLQAMESVAHGRAVSGDAVHAWLGSWGRDDELPPPKPGQ